MISASSTDEIIQKADTSTGQLQELFGRVLPVMIQNNTALRAEMIELFKPLLAGKMTFEEHQNFLKEQLRAD